MKIFIAMPMLLLTMAVFAQNRHELNDPAMQDMMEEMQKLQACMAKIDQSHFGDIEDRQHQFQEEVRSLCASGNRDAAQKRAIVFGTEMSNHPAIKEIRECGKLGESDVAKEIVSDMAFNMEESNTHICDEM